MDQKVKRHCINGWGQRTFPNVFIGGKHIGGCDNTVALHNQGKLMPLLTDAGELQASAHSSYYYVIHVDVNGWKCGFCKKSFRAEKFLDKHFVNCHSNLIDDSQGRCLADLCNALHCDLVIESKKPKGKCNPDAAARNRHLCESLADSCFPVSQGSKASHLHEFFLRQFCDAHTCSSGPKPFSKGGKKRTNVFWLASSILIILLLPLFYLLVYLHRRDAKAGSNQKSS